MFSRKLGIAGLQLKKDYVNQELNIKNFEMVSKIQKKKFPWIDLIFTGELYLQNIDHLHDTQLYSNVVVPQ